MNLGPHEVSWRPDRGSSSVVVVAVRFKFAHGVASAVYVIQRLSVASSVNVILTSLPRVTECENLDLFLKFFRSKDISSMDDIHHQQLFFPTLPLMVLIPTTFPYSIFLTNDPPSAAIRSREIRSQQSYAIDT
jgi:hypothetical protein